MILNKSDEGKSVNKMGNYLTLTPVSIQTLLQSYRVFLSNASKSSLCALVFYLDTTFQHLNWLDIIIFQNNV